MNRIDDMNATGLPLLEEEPQFVPVEIPLDHEKDPA